MPRASQREGLDTVVKNCKVAYPSEERLGGSRGEKTMHLPSLSTGQKFVLTAWLLAPPLYAYWRGDRRWIIYDLKDPDIQSAFLSDLVWAYIIGGVLAALLILIWKKED